MLLPYSGSNMNHDAVGQFRQLGSGERLLVDVVGLPDGSIFGSALYRYIEGEIAGHRGNCWDQNVELLGYDNLLPNLEGRGPAQKAAS